MTDPHDDGDLPPDLPPEYAEAYRRGYRRALENPGGEETQAQLPPLKESTPAAPTPVRPDETEPRDRRWLAPVLLVLAALVLVGIAYGVGRLFASDLAQNEVTEVPNVIPESPAEPTTEPAEEQEPGSGRYQGPVSRVAVASGEGSCQSDDSVDAAGETVSYDAALAFDDDASTAWRCDGNGAGESLTLQLGGEVQVGQVGLIPGYAKTDPADGSDRYAENNRITRVRWVFSDGTEVVQRLDPAPDNRSLQTRRIPLTAADEVTLEILGSTGGERNTVAVSDVLVAAGEPS